MARRVSVARKVVGLVTAIVFTPVGFAALWYGTAELSANRAAGILIVIVGIAVLLIVVQTGHASSLGLAVAGAAASIFGFAGLIMPQLAQSSTSFFGGFASQLETGAKTWLSFGLVLAIGLVLLGIAIGSWTARNPTERSNAPALRSFISIVLGLAGMVAGFGFVTRSTMQFVLLGAIVLGLVALTALVSSAGLFVVGFISFVIGILGLVFQPFALAIARSQPVGGNGMLAGAQTALEVGFVAAIGAIYLAAGVVARAARARGRRHS